MSEMKRAIMRDEQERAVEGRYASTLVIAAAIIAAVRLARDDISTQTPRLVCAVSDSVRLARLILKRVMGT